ncbi:MAG: hypothetical protein SZ59_C0001G0174 [candidate division TM6 bacterium GW2011_GWF2_28_16]|nr:MAG: hypothetical protein SZ59_C0001G0174 [candidate division TM6 bacterium GW2011_GWF2_28_16]
MKKLIILLIIVLLTNNIFANNTQKFNKNNVTIDFNSDGNPEITIAPQNTEIDINSDGTQDLKVSNKLLKKIIITLACAITVIYGTDSALKALGAKSGTEKYNFGDLTDNTIKKLQAFGPNTLTFIKENSSKILEGLKNIFISQQN